MENCCEGDEGGVAKQPPEHRPKRLAKTADELATVTQSPQRRDARAALNPKSWAAAEVVCHLRDVEEGIQAATTSHTSAQRRQRYRHDSSWRASGHDRGRRRRFAAFGQPDTEDPPRQSRQTRARGRPVGKLDFG